jgi:sarcosine oxidase subunit alpha
MAQQFRTTSGGQIDRGRTISFTFDGKSYQGYEGDTLASALLANGVHLLGRSFKYHRPRYRAAQGTQYARHHNRIVRRPGRQ